MAATRWHSECTSAVWQLDADGSARPTWPGNTCRSASTSDTSATGTPSVSATSRANRSIPGSAVVDSRI